MAEQYRALAAQVSRGSVSGDGASEKHECAGKASPKRRQEYKGKGRRQSWIVPWQRMADAGRRQATVRLESTNVWKGIAKEASTVYMIRARQSSIVPW